MLVGALYLMVAAIIKVWTFLLSFEVLRITYYSIKVGGVGSFINKFSYAIPSSTLYSNLSCGLPNHDYFNLIRDANSDFPWPGMSFGKRNSFQ